MAIADNIKQSFNGLNPRERVIVVGGAIALLLIALYLLVWEPLMAKQAALNASIKSQQLIYQQMLKSAEQVKKFKAGGNFKTINASAMQSIINRSAKAALPGAIIKRVEQNRQQAVQVWIDQVAFDDMIKWLGALQQTKGIRVVALFSERTDKAGRVNVRLTLKAG